MAMQDRHFVIYDLRFDCQYLIRVQPVSSQGVTGTVAHVTMETPPCRQVAVVGDVRPDCPNSCEEHLEQLSSIRRHHQNINLA